MCRFLSGVIMKNRVVLAPIYNQSHSDLLKQLNIEDNYTNASRIFVRAELIPKNDNRTTPVDEWEFIIDQDVTPDWFDIDRGRYEEEMREAAKEWIKEHIIVAAGYAWEKVNYRGETRYIMSGIYKKMHFGKNNNYAESDVLKDLDKSKLLADLKHEFGDKLKPIVTDLTSLDGFKTYGKVTDRYLSIPTQDMIMECGSQISCTDAYWLATPNQTTDRGDSSYVQIVYWDGICVFNDCGWGGRGVRPFFILES